MKKLLIILLILLLPATICMLLYGIVSMDYWLFGGQMIANELAGKVNNGFVAVIYLFSSVFFMIVWFFFICLLMNWDTILKNQQELDRLREGYVNKDNELNKLIAQYRCLILNQLK